MAKSNETPKQAYNKGSKAIGRNLKAVCEQWEHLDKIYNQRLKNNPKSWEGIGRGSELEDLQILTEKMVNLMKVFSE